MSTSVKIQAFLAYTMAVCLVLIQKCEDQKSKILTGKKAATVKWRAEKLIEACQDASDNYRLGKIDRSKIRQVSRAYNKIDDIGWMQKQYHIESTLAFLMLGFDRTRAKGIDVVVRRLSWLLRFFDPGLKHNQRYEVADREYRRFMGKAA